MDKIPIVRIPEFVSSSNRERRFIWNLEECLEKLYSILQKIKAELQFDEEAVMVRVTGKGVFFERENPDCLDSSISMFSEYFD